MVVPTKAAKTTTKKVLFKEPAIAAKEISVTTSLSSHPVEPVKSTKPRKEIRMVDVSQMVHQSSQKEESEETEESKPQDDQDTNSNPAPLGRLASKMKLMLRRRNTTEKKKQRKERDYYEVDRVENVHWTEM